MCEQETKKNKKGVLFMKHRVQLTVCWWFDKMGDK